MHPKCDFDVVAREKMLESHQLVWLRPFLRILSPSKIQAKVDRCFGGDRVGSNPITTESR